MAHTTGVVKWFDNEPGYRKNVVFRLTYHD